MYLKHKAIITHTVSCTSGTNGLTESDQVWFYVPRRMLSKFELHARYHRSQWLIRLTVVQEINRAAGSSVF